MPHRTLTNTVILAADPRAVFDHLREPTSYIGLSPLVVDVQDVTETAKGRRYVAIERFRLGPLRYDNSIAVSIVAVEADSAHFAVSGRVKSPGGIRLCYDYAISAHPDGTVLVDTLQISAPIGLARFAASQARSVQLSRGLILAERLS